MHICLIKSLNFSRISFLFWWKYFKKYYSIKKKFKTHKSIILTHYMKTNMRIINLRKLHGISTLKAKQ
jgi:hypothetical protein